MSLISKIFLRLELTFFQINDFCLFLLFAQLCHFIVIIKIKFCYYNNFSKVQIVSKFSCFDFYYFNDLLEYLDNSKVLKFSFIFLTFLKFIKSSQFLIFHFH